MTIAATALLGALALLALQAVLNGRCLRRLDTLPAAVGPSVAVNAPDAKGVYQYMDGGKRYLRGEIPSKAAFFDKSGAINVVTNVPPNDVQPDYPCDGCPSSGGAAS